MIESEFMNKLKAIISSSEQASIFGGDSHIDKVIKECICFLRYKGFKITEPKIFKAKIENNDDLIKYFYLLSNSKFPGDYTTSCNWKKDRNIAKIFVENRMNISGTGKEYALNECGEIISTVFEHYDEFKFKYAINFSIFGQDNLKWVTDRAIQLMNKELQEKEEVDAEILREKIIASQDDSDLGFNDLDDLLAKMEE